MPEGKSDIRKGLDPDMFSSGLFDGDEPDDLPEDEETEQTENSEDQFNDDPAENVSEDVVETDDASEEDDPEDADAQAAAPVGKTRKKTVRKPKITEPSAKAHTYVVQRGFAADGGRTFHSGDVVPVKCKYCGLWKAEYLGKVRCFPGKVLPDGTTMDEDRFSCESFFICKELDAELTNFLRMSPFEVIVVKRMLPGVKRLFDALGWIKNYIEKNDLEDDTDEVFRTARNFVMAFGSKEQILYAEDFIRLYAKQQSSKVQPKIAAKTHFRGGDWVEWTDLKTGDLLEGIMLTNFRGTITIAGLKQVQGARLSFNLQDWVDKCSPRITRKSADLPVSE